MPFAHDPTEMDFTVLFQVGTDKPQRMLKLVSQQIGRWPSLLGKPIRFLDVSHPRHCSYEIIVRPKQPFNKTP